MPETITVQNHSTKLSEAEFTALVAALREQALEHYNKSTWVTGVGTIVVTDVVRISPEQKPTNWHIEILDVSPEPGALGFHEDEARQSTAYSRRGLAAGTEVPLAKVYAQTAQEAGVEPSEVASHEMLEMLVDPWVTQEGTIRKYLEPQSGKYYIAEVGDPVQGEGYVATAGNSALVANFALPAWWAVPSALVGLPYDYRQTRKTPFELAPGGYISVQSPGGQWEQIYGEGSPAPEPEPTPEPAPEEPLEEPRPEKEAEEEEEPPEPPGEPSCQEQLEAAEARIEELEAMDGKVP